MTSRTFFPRIASMWLLAGALLTLSCTSDSEPEERAAVDGLNRSVSLSHPPERILSLAPSATEIIYAAGAGHKLVGVTTADDYPRFVDTLAQVSALPVNFEAIVDLNPDLVFASDQVNAARDAETLANLDIPTYFVAAHTLSEIYDAIRAVGTLTDTRDQAQKVVDSLKAEEATLQQAAERVENRPRVLFLVGDDTLYSFGRNSHIHELIHLAGGQSITSNIRNPAPTLSEEYVIEHAPDVIIGAFGEDYVTERLLELHPSWDQVPAVKNGRVYTLDADIVLRPGPRLIEGAKRMGAMLHPEIY